MNAEPNRTTSPEDLLSEAETLIWALLDDQLEEVDVARLEQLLTSHESVRRRYAECVQLHVDLTEHFSPRDRSVAEGDILNQLISENLPGPEGTHTPLGE